jgi:nicotinamide riboside kinase
MMENQPGPWVNISGDYEQRLQKAVKTVDELLARQ